LCTAAKADRPQFHERLPFQEITMFANGAFKNPFTDFDFTKIVGEFKLPQVNVETFVETTRKNFAAFTSANTAAVESIKAIGQRQGDMVRAAMEDLSKHGSEVLAAATVEEKAAKQIDFAKKSYESAIANTKELADLYSKGQHEAFAALSGRVTELAEEVKAAFVRK
jgi:phasin family protein